MSLLKLKESLPLPWEKKTIRMKQSSSSQWYGGTQLSKQPTIKYILVVTKGILPQTRDIWSFSLLRAVPFNTTHPLSKYCKISSLNKCSLKKKRKRLGVSMNGQMKQRFSSYVSGKLPTYPYPKPTLALTSHLGQNVCLGEG